ncbi:hypothetical protein V1523DRAFT_415516 [Lipomyces doorenjongii]
MKSELVKNAAEFEFTCQTRSTRRSERNKNKKSERAQSMRTREFKSSDSSLLEIRSCPSDNVVAHTKDDDDGIYWSSSHYSQYAEEVKERQQELRSEPPEQLESMHDKKPCQELSAGHTLNTELLIAKSSRYVKPFEKPARRPMREDRDLKRKKASGVLASEKKGKKRSKVDARNPEGVGRSIDGKKSHRNKATKKSKPIASLVSTLSNITEGIGASRLTIPHKISAGIFSHGRQAGNRPILGVPDLTFSRIDKLTESSKSSITARHENVVLNVEAKKFSSLHHYPDHKNSESTEHTTTVNTTKSAKDTLSVSQPIADVVEICDANCKEFSSRVAKRRQRNSPDQNSIISPRPIHVHERKTLATLEANVKEQTFPVGNAQTSEDCKSAAPALDNPSFAMIEGPHIAPHPNEISRRIKECTPNNSGWKKTSQDAPLPQTESHLHNISPRQAIYKSAHANQCSYHQPDNTNYAAETPSHEYHYEALMHPVSAKDEHYENGPDYPFHERPGEGHYYCETADDFDPSIPAIQIYDGRDDISGREFRDYRRNPEGRDYSLVENNRADETYINDESSIPGVSTSAYYGQHILNADGGSMGLDQYINNEYQYFLTDTSMTTFDLSVSDIQPVGSTAESEETSRLPRSSYSFGAQSDTLNMYHIDSPQPPKFKRHRLY